MMVVILSIIVILVIIIYLLSNRKKSSPLTSDSYTNTRPLVSKPQLKILMVGNSFITKNNMWKILQSMLGSEYYIQVIAPPSASLKQHRQSGGLITTLITNRWDYIVLQEKSINPLRYPERLPRTIGKMIKYINNYQIMGWIPVLYETYSKCYIQSGDPEGDQQIISQAYQQAGKENKCPVAKVGQAFMKFRLLDQYDITDPILLRCTKDDSTHPTTMGSLLTALVFYSLFTGREAASAPIERDDLILIFMDIVDSL